MKVNHRYENLVKKCQIRYQTGALSLEMQHISWSHRFYVRYWTYLIDSGYQNLHSDTEYQILVRPKLDRQSVICTSKKGCSAVKGHKVLRILNILYFIINFGYFPYIPDTTRKAGSTLISQICSKQEATGCCVISDNEGGHGHWQFTEGKGPKVPPYKKDLNDPLRPMANILQIKRISTILLTGGDQTSSR